MNSNGKDFLDSSGKPQFTSGESRKALEAMKSLLPYMDPQVTTFDQPKVQQQMFNGTAAMAIMFSGRMNDLTLPANTKLADKFAFAAPPALEKSSPTSTAASPWMAGPSRRTPSWTRTCSSR